MARSTTIKHKERRFASQFTTLYFLVSLFTHAFLSTNYRSNLRSFHSLSSACGSVFRCAKVIRVTNHMLISHLFIERRIKTYNDGRKSGIWTKTKCIPKRACSEMCGRSPLEMGHILILHYCFQLPGRNVCYQ